MAGVSKLEPQGACEISHPLSLELSAGAVRRHTPGTAAVQGHSAGSESFCAQNFKWITVPCECENIQVMSHLVIR